MKTIIELITDELKSVFTECGYDESYARVTVSNRPDLCEFQCNGAMAAAKAYKKAPFMIADGDGRRRAGHGDRMFRRRQQLRGHRLPVPAEEFRRGEEDTRDRRGA